jgi:hypothetical protein
MTERRLQNTVSVSLIVAHVLIVVLVFALFLAQGLTSDDLTTSLSIILPMLGALTGLAVSYVIKVKKKKTMQEAACELSGIYVFTALLLPAVFVAGIGTVVVLRAFNRGFSSDSQFKGALASLETAFGAYTGKVLGSLFGKGKV